MQLEVECTWNEQRNKAQEVIRFDYRPHTLFAMPEEEIALLQELLRKLPQTGPQALQSLKLFQLKYTKSMYAHFCLYKSLELFGYNEEQKTLFKEIKRLFPSELLTQCMLASQHLKTGNFKKFTAVFHNQEVPKALFPKRKQFYFEEVLYFHHLWALYFDTQGNHLQSQTHQKFIVFLINTHQSFHMSESTTDAHHSCEIC